MSNPVQTENTQPGNNDWVLTNPATNREIEGYASLTSVNRGNPINFFVSTSGPYTIDTYRLGWYKGDGARKMAGSPVHLTGTVQPIPAPTADGFFECNWAVSHTLSVGNDWVSGVYVAKLTQSSSGKQSYIIFVVRDDDRASDYLFQSSVTTFQAYNNWPGIANGGKSLYEHNSAGGLRATQVSFNRPYTIEPTAGTTDHRGPASGVGAGEFFTVNNTPATDIIYSAAWECNMVRFLEREGFDVTYSTNIDTHANGRSLLLHKGFISVGHDEYYSLEMRNSLETARDGGVSLGFFGANIAYWQIRLNPSVIDGSKPYRTMVCYKYAGPGETIGPLDPIIGGGPSDPSLTAGDIPVRNRTTVKWRDAVLNRPEDELVGVMTDLAQGIPVDTDIIVADASHSVFTGTQLQNNSPLRGLLGYETDRRFGNAPANTVTLAHSPTHPTGSDFSDMTIYTVQSGAIVFATGSPQWNWGLDDYNAPTLRSSRLNTQAQQITRNVLNKMVQGLSIPTTSTAKFVEADDKTQGSWKGVYGTDGYNVFHDAENDPSYAQVLVGGTTGDPWAASTLDVRGLQKANGSADRIAAFRFSETNFMIDINLTDAQEHCVALYCLDWDGQNKRSQKLEVFDAGNNELLDSRDVDKFTAGQYLVWLLQGHVKIKVTHEGDPGSNAVVSGLFFGAPVNGSASGTATFVEADDTTQGNWKGVYGADGYNIFEDEVNDPSYAVVSPSGNTPYTELDHALTSSPDVHWLQKAATGSTERNFSSWFSETDFTLDINLTDGQEHRVALYCLDWDDDKRAQRLEVFDAGSNDLLDRQDVDKFSAGRYLVWRLKGHVRIKVSHKGPPHSNAVVSGLFFD